jgi:Holliday junction resolvasome RuvABC endonuclease subunit
MEDIQMQGNVVNNVQTFKVLAEVFGVVSELLVEMKIPQSAVLASSWKSALGIKGRARAEQKQNAQKWVVDTYSVKPTQDECDAICIGAHRNQHTPDIGFDWAD